MKKQANAISGLEKMLEDQNVVLAKQTVLMERISAKVFPPESKNLNIFPIDTIDDLEKWTIGDNNPEDVVGLQGGYKNLQNKCFFSYLQIAYIKKIIGRQDISKNVHLFFTENCLSEVNWDGLQKKFAVKNCKLFTEYVFGKIYVIILPHIICQ